MAPLNILNPPNGFILFTQRSKAVLLFWILFVIVFIILSYLCSLQPCDYLLGRADHLALLFVMFICVLSLSHMVARVRRGT